MAGIYWQKNTGKGRGDPIVGWLILYQGKFVASGCGNDILDETMRQSAAMAPLEYLRWVGIHYSSAYTYATVDLTPEDESSR